MTRTTEMITVARHNDVTQPALNPELICLIENEIQYDHMNHIYRVRDPAQEKDRSTIKNSSEYGIREILMFRDRHVKGNKPNNDRNRIFFNINTAIIDVATKTARLFPFDKPG